MANKFEIVISAVDKATAVMRHVEAQTDKITAPVRKLGQSMSDFSRASGLSNVGKELGKVRDIAGDVAGKVASILPPLAGLAGVASAAGIAAMATSWGSAGAEIGRTSSVLGVGTTRLQELRGAARLAGLSADDMTGGLKSLGNTLEDAVTGRNLTAAGVMRQFGVTLHRTKDGAVDSARALIDVSNAMKKLGGNVQAQQKFASIFGIESLLPLLQKGGAGIDAYVRQFDKLGGVMSPAELAKADQFNTNMIQLEMTFDRLKWKVGEALAPTMQEFANWLAGVDWNATVKSIDDIVKEVKSAVDWMGGWKNVAELLVGVMGLKLVGSLIIATVKIGLMVAQWRAVSAAAEDAEKKQLAASNAGTNPAGKMGWLMNLAKIGETAFFAHEGLKLIDPNDDMGTWVDDHVPGASVVENAASKIGLGRSYDEQRQITQRQLEQQYQLPKGVLNAVRHVESDDGKNLRSPKGALGPFQFMPSTAKEYGINPMDEQQATKAAAMKLRGLLNADGGDLATALADWNWGEGNRKKLGIAHAPAETRGFVDKVFKAMGYSGKALPSLYQNSSPAAIDTGTPTGTVVAANQPGSDAGGGGSGGQVDVVVEFVNAPAGMRPHIKTSGNVTARIGHSEIGLAPL